MRKRRWEVSVCVCVCLCVCMADLGALLGRVTSQCVGFSSGLAVRIHVCIFFLYAYVYIIYIYISVQENNKEEEMCVHRYINIYIYTYNVEWVLLKKKSVHIQTADYNAGRVGLWNQCALTLSASSACGETVLACLCLIAPPTMLSTSESLISFLGFHSIR